MKKEDFVKSGFVRMMNDLEFKYSYDLSHPDVEYDGEKPAILFNSNSSEFCITDGEMMFIYFKADTPEKAVEWASMVSRFEPNGF